VLDVIRTNRAETPEKILTKTFDLVDAYVGRAPRRDDLTLVLLKTG
jgi:serine phosphatase RsbU (regulator of sigma subunit)